MKIILFTSAFFSPYFKLLRLSDIVSLLVVLVLAVVVYSISKEKNIEID